MFSITLFTALLLATAANASQSFNAHPQGQFSNSPSQMGYRDNGAPQGVVSASDVNSPKAVAYSGPTQTHPSSANSGFQTDAAHGKSPGSHQEGKRASEASIYGAMDRRERGLCQGAMVLQAPQLHIRTRPALPPEEMARNNQAIHLTPVFKPELADARFPNGAASLAATHPTHATRYIGTVRKK
ncbi:hypothetical protein PCANC_06393 [Puccinia coronata f. sp. avenae]|uniref:Uncharacterized protein n=1 Tax=Puccinia coronata f. sp. avenae TaxID=200324 RepID=A0A2N5VVN8_9BASI|nr:hypothetical protein PCASD_10016 [Puccinia coronata f. sp. avenae]PLW54065.1 hypothetical protein PCANC_06393 [Puccinia coronata f. sp. avenae]